MTGQKTSVVHCKKDRFDIYIGRPSKWGNPFTHLSDRKTRAAYIVRSREEAIERYEEYLFSSGLAADIEELRGKVLGCWCSPKACHGDVLARLLNALHKEPGSLEAWVARGPKQSPSFQTSSSIN